MRTHAMGYLGLVFMLLAPASAAAQQAPSGAFSLVSDAAPTVVQEMRYITPHNFIGRPIKGYRDAECILTRQAADALAQVQAAVRPRGYTLKVYDCYRPQRAVDDFVAWGKRLKDQKMKAEFYPRVDKRNVFKDGYIATSPATHAAARWTSRSSSARPASRSATTAATGCATAPTRAPSASATTRSTWARATTASTSKSHPFAASVTKKQRRNRLILRRAMLAAGFKGLETEWWHFTLRDEPFPETFFDFPVARSSLSG